MAEMKTTMSVEGRTFHAQIATIERTSLSLDPVFTAFLHLGWTGGGIGAGGYTLDAPVTDESGRRQRIGTGFGADHIMRLIETVGATSWEDLAGKGVFVLFKSERLLGATAAGIAGLHNGRVLIFKEHVESWENSEGVID